MIKVLTWLGFVQQAIQAVKYLRGQLHLGLGRRLHLIQLEVGADG